MKKLTAILLVLAAVLSLCACGTKNEDPMENIRPGMTEADMRGLFGEPDGIADDALSSYVYNDVVGFGKNGELHFSPGHDGDTFVIVSFQVEENTKYNKAIKWERSVLDYYTDKYGEPDGKRISSQEAYESGVWDDLCIWEMESGGSLQLWVRNEDSEKVIYIINRFLS